MMSVEIPSTHQKALLDKEYGLLVERLGEKRGHDTRFFAFCNTVAARNFAGTNECHGWVGVRFQSEVSGEPNTIILHINMFDDTNVAQQEVVGITEIIRKRPAIVKQRPYVIRPLSGPLTLMQALIDCWLSYPSKTSHPCISPNSASAACTQAAKVVAINS
jgi:hypothetical protein